MSHEWLSFDHPDPSACQLERLKRIFEGVIAGRGDEFFTDADWVTFASGHSRSWSRLFAHFEGGAQDRKLSASSFQQDVEKGMVWLDFSSVPQKIDADPSTVTQVTEHLRRAVQSIPSYLERCSYFWVLTPTARHADLSHACGFSSWRSKGWCRVEEWANFLSIPALMPLVVSDRKLLSTYSMLSFMLDNTGKPERAPCRGAFSCCRVGHSIEVGETPTSIPCDKDEIVKMLKRRYEAKVRDLLNVAPLMAYTMLALETMVYAGAEHFSSDLPANVVHRDEGDTPEAFASAVGFSHVEGKGGAGHDLLQVAVLCHHNAMVRRLLALRPSGAPWHRVDMGGTAFSVCCVSGNVEAARLLCDTGDVNVDVVSLQNSLGASPIHLAAGSGHVKLVELILMHRGEVDVAKASHSSEAGRTALHCEFLRHGSHLFVPLPHHVPAGSYHFCLSDWIKLLSLHFQQVIQAVFSLPNRHAKLIRHFSGLTFRKILDALRPVFTSDFQNFFLTRWDRAYLSRSPVGRAGNFLPLSHRYTCS